MKRKKKLQITIKQNQFPNKISRKQ